MTDKNNKPSLPEQLREQLNLHSWNRDSTLLRAAAEEIEKLRDDINVSNEFFGEQMMFLNKKVAELEIKLKFKRLN